MRTWTRISMPAFVLVWAGSSSPAFSQVFFIDWFTLDSGGGVSAGGGFELSGTVGQPDAGTMSGGGFELQGGFWAAAVSSGVPTPTLIGAVSRKACDLPIPLASPRASEPRQGGITQVCVTYADTAPSAGVTVEEDASCPSPPSYVAHSGAAVADCTAVGTELCCTFTPALENGRAYRLTVPSAGATAHIELRGLLGDANGDGSVNSLDRSTVVAAWTGGGFSCATDLNSDGTTNAGDRSIVVGAWTGGQNCAP